MKVDQSTHKKKILIITHAKISDLRKNVKKFLPTQKTLARAKIYLTNATRVKIMTHVKC